MYVHRGYRAVALSDAVSDGVPCTAAESVLAPTACPIVQAPALAVPSAPVTAVALATDPPPAVTENVTVAPETAALFASTTLTAGLVGASPLIRTVCPAPDTNEIAAGGADGPVEPLSPPPPQAAMRVHSNIGIARMRISRTSKAGGGEGSSAG